MQRKLIHGFLAALLMVMQLCTLVGIRHVQAVESPTVQETLIDSNDLKLEVSGVQNGQTVDWTVKYERKVSTNARALKLNVKAADTLLAPKDAKTWQELQATNTKWWQEKDFTTKSSGILRYQTSIDQLSLTITAQLDEQQPVIKAVTSAESETAEAQAVEATKTPTVTADLLDAKVAGPHTITLVLPESEVDEPVPDPEDEAAQDQATSESVVADTLPSAPVEDEKTETSAEEEPVTVEDDDSEEVTTEEEANTETAEAPADEPKTKAAEDKVIDPDTTLPQVQATNLVLQRYQFSKLAIESETGDIVFKAPSGTQNYDSEQNMRDFTSKNYTEGSSSGAVIFSQSDGLNATIDLSYDDVGLVQLTNGTSVRIGARVTVSKLTYRNSDWGNSTKMAMDFSNNFYSGLQLANVRQFDWKITFFVVARRDIPAPNIQNNPAGFASFPPDYFAL